MQLDIWGRCKSPQRGLGRCPNGNLILCILALKSDIWWHQMRINNDQTVSRVGWILGLSHNLGASHDFWRGLCPPAQRRTAMHWRYALHSKEDSGRTRCSVCWSTGHGPPTWWRAAYDHRSRMRFVFIISKVCRTHGFLRIFKVLMNFKNKVRSREKLQIEWKSLMQTYWYNN